MARVYDFWLGGKDNYAADRVVAEQVAGAYPDIRDAVRAQRAFLARVVRFLVTEAGIRQFLDIGTGLPSANNTHQVAQRAAPQSRVVYVDNDPIVLSHARALLTSSPEGRPTTSTPTCAIRNRSWRRRPARWTSPSRSPSCSSRSCISFPTTIILTKSLIL